MRILSIKCASCAAPLQIKPETKEFVCAYCGSEQVVDRSGGIVTLNLVAETLGKVLHGTENTASELALVRVKKELDANIFSCFYYTLHEPVPPNVKRLTPKPFWKVLFMSVSDRALEACERSVNNIEWDEYDRNKAAFDKEVRDLPRLEKICRSAQAKRKIIEAEYLRHLSIVKGNDSTAVIELAELWGRKYIGSPINHPIGWSQEMPPESLFDESEDD